MLLLIGGEAILDSLPAMFAVSKVAVNRHIYVIIFWTNSCDSQRAWHGYCYKN